MTILEDIVTPRIRTIPKTGFIDYGPMPHGYATAADATSILTLKPGESVLFSVPVNHVAPGWFLQVGFQFDLPPVEHGAAQPVCYSIGTTYPKSLTGFQFHVNAFSAVRHSLLFSANA